MIDEKALAFIANTVLATQKPYLLAECSGGREATYAIGGKVTTELKKIAPRTHHVNSLDDLIASAIKLSTGPDAVVWYNEQHVVAILNDDEFRDDMITFTLQYTEVFKRVANLKESFDQKRFVRLLRIELAGTLPPITLLNPVRKVKFENGLIVKGEVSRQRESMSRELKSEVTTDGADLPEGVSLQVKILKNFGEDIELPVKCSVEVDPSEGTFWLLPLPDEIQRVQNWVLADIGERLKAGLGEIPCFLGSP